MRDGIDLRCRGRPELRAGVAGERPLHLPCKSDDACLTFAADAYCYPFRAFDGTGYCVEGCTPGQSFDTQCNDRLDQACQLIGLIPRNATCADTSQCGAGELC